jgi:hypothetical protein
MLRSAVAVVCVMALSSGCSSPPDKERHQAEGAIAAARAADAGRYASRALEMAESALAGYDAAVAQRDYREALRLALEARDTAFQAARDASDEKAAARSRAEQLLAEGATLLAAVDARGDTRAAGRVTPGAEVAAATIAADARAVMQEARLKLGQADYRGAAEALGPVIALLRAEMDPAPTSAAAPR